MSFVFLIHCKDNYGRDRAIGHLVCHLGLDSEGVPALIVNGLYVRSNFRSVENDKSILQVVEAFCQSAGIKSIILGHRYGDLSRRPPLGFNQEDLSSIRLSSLATDLYGDLGYSKSNVPHVVNCFYRRVKEAAKKKVSPTAKNSPKVASPRQDLEVLRIPEQEHADLVIQEAPAALPAPAPVPAHAAPVVVANEEPPIGEIAPNEAPAYAVAPAVMMPANQEVVAPPAVVPAPEVNNLNESRALARIYSRISLYSNDPQANKNQITTDLLTFVNRGNPAEFAVAKCLALTRMVSMPELANQREMLRGRLETYAFNPPQDVNSFARVTALGYFICFNDEASRARAVLRSLIQHPLDTEEAMILGAAYLGQLNLVNNVQSQLARALLYVAQVRSGARNDINVNQLRHFAFSEEQEISIDARCSALVGLLEMNIDRQQALERLREIGQQPVLPMAAGFIHNGEKSFAEFLARRVEIVERPENDVTVQYRTELRQMLARVVQNLESREELHVELKGLCDGLKSLRKSIGKPDFKVYLFNSIVKDKEDYLLGHFDFENHALFIARDLMEKLKGEWGGKLEEEYLFHELICPIYGHARAIKLQRRVFTENHPSGSILDDKGILKVALREFIDRQAQSISGARLEAMDPLHQTIAPAFLLDQAI